MRFTFQFAEKHSLEPVLPKVFKILYTNMNLISPTGGTYEEDYKVWREYIAPAMQEEHRQMVLMFYGEDLAGYFQYNVQDSLFMMEEIQIKPEQHGNGMFREMYRWLRGKLPESIVYVEAYSNKNNVKSQKILEHLGLSRIGENQSGSSYHYRGTCRELWDCLG